MTTELLQEANELLGEKVDELTRELARLTAERDTLREERTRIFGEAARKVLSLYNRAAEIIGSRFSTTEEQLAQLERALKDGSP